MDRSGHRHHPDHSSSSSSSRPTHFQSQKFQTQNAKSSNSDRASGYGTSDNTRKSSSVLPSNFRTTEQDQVEKEEDVSNLPSLVGTCPYMCPERERAQRERLRDLAVFERLYGDPRKSSSSLAVKKFCRTISTKHAQTSDVRPLPVLVNTLDYLLNLLDSTDQSFEVVHDFIFDRTRSIRQDLSMQNIVNDKAIHMYEEMVKFHIISHHKLRNCSSSSNTSSAHHLNLEQLTKALTSLYNLYGANRKSNTVYKNEAEFQSFHILLHLGSSSQPMGESLSLWFRDVPSLILKSKEMCFARKILRFFRMGNYKQFLSTTAAEASYLQYCIIEPYINEVRALAVSCINNGGYKLHPYPLAQISRLLMMKELDTEALCTACGLEICRDEIGDKLLPTKQTTLCRPKGGFQNYSFLGLERFERQT